MLVCAHHLPIPYVYGIQYEWILAPLPKYACIAKILKKRLATLAPFIRHIQPLIG